MNYNIIPRYPNNLYNIHNPDSVRSEKSVFNIATQKTVFVDDIDRHIYSTDLYGFFIDNSGIVGIKLDEDNINIELYFVIFYLVVPINNPRPYLIEFKNGLNYWTPSINIENFYNYFTELSNNNYYNVYGDYFVTKPDDIENSSQFMFVVYEIIQLENRYKVVIIDQSDFVGTPLTVSEIQSIKFIFYLAIPFFHDINNYILKRDVYGSELIRLLREDEEYFIESFDTNMLSIERNRLVMEEYKLFHNIIDESPESPESPELGELVESPELDENIQSTLTIHGQKHFFNVKLPEEIFDLIMYDNVLLQDFLSDDDNLIFLLEGEFIAISKYFLANLDEYTVYDCGTVNNGSFGRVKRELQNDPNSHLPYINMEKIGIKLKSLPVKMVEIGGKLKRGPSPLEIGILVPLEMFKKVITTNSKIILLKVDNNIEPITSVVSKQVLDNAVTHGLVSALHCQGNYVGSVFNCINTEIEKKIIYTIVNEDQRFDMTYHQISRFSEFPLQDNITEYNISKKTFDLMSFITTNPQSYFTLSKEDRDYLELKGYTNPLNYDPKYFLISEEEKIYRNLKDFDHCIDITDDTELLKKTKKLSESCFPGENTLPEKIKGYPSRIKDSIFDLFYEFKDNIIIAGGAALSLYYSKYNRAISSSDVDIFFINCTPERALEIIRAIESKSVATGENKMLFTINRTRNTEHAYTLYKTYHPNPTISYPIYVEIQFIKRIYSSPSEIIHGFDVDSCCILATMDKKYYTTKRGYYALQHKYNTVNFNHLSPSYEYRCLKYLDRTFNLYIPQMSQLKNNMIFDENVFPVPNRGAYIILSFLLNGQYDSVTNLSNYYLTPTQVETMNFVVVNPSGQTNTSFTQIVLKDNLEWYPKYPKELENPFIAPIFNNNLMTIHKGFIPEPIFGNNIISKKKQNYRNIVNSTLIKTLFQLFPHRFVLVGESVLTYLTDKRMPRISVTIIDICFIEDPNNPNDSAEQIQMIQVIKDLLISGFKSLFIFNYNYSKNPDETDISNYNESIYNGTFNDYKFKRIDYSVGDYYDTENDRESLIHIPSIRIFDQVFKNISEVFETQKYDFGRICINTDGQFITDEKGYYSITHEIELDHVIDRQYSKKGYKYLSKFGYKVNVNKVFNTLERGEYIDVFNIDNIIVKRDDGDSDSDNDSDDTPQPQRLRPDSPPRRRSSPPPQSPSRVVNESDENDENDENDSTNSDIPDHDDNYQVNGESLTSDEDRPRRNFQTPPRHITDDFPITRHTARHFPNTRFPENEQPPLQEEVDSGRRFPEIHSHGYQIGENAPGRFEQEVLPSFSENNESLYDISPEIPSTTLEVFDILNTRHFFDDIDITSFDIFRRNFSRNTTRYINTTNRFFFYGITHNMFLQLYELLKTERLWTYLNSIDFFTYSAFSDYTRNMPNADNVFYTLFFNRMGELGYFSNYPYPITDEDIENIRHRYSMPIQRYQI